MGDRGSSRVDPDVGRPRPTVPSWGRPGGTLGFKSFKSLSDASRTVTRARARARGEAIDMRGDKTLEVQAVVLGEKLAEKELECNNLRTANARLKAEWSNAQEEIRKLQKDQGIAPKTKLEERKGLDAIADLCLSLEKKTEAVDPKSKGSKENDGKIDLVFESLQKIDAKLRQKFEREIQHQVQENEKPKKFEKMFNADRDGTSDKVERAEKKDKPSHPRTNAVARAIEQFQQKANPQPEAKSGPADADRKGAGRPPVPIKRIGAGFPPQFARKDAQAGSADGPSKETLAELDSLKKEKEDAVKKMKDLMEEVKQQQEHVLDVQKVSDNLSSELDEHRKENERMLAETDRLQSMVKDYSELEAQVRTTLKSRIGTASKDIAGLVDSLKAYDEQVQEQISKIQEREKEVAELAKSLREKSSNASDSANEHCRNLEAELQKLQEKVVYYEEEVSKQQQQISISKQQQLDLSRSLKDLKDQKDQSVSSLEKDLFSYKSKVSQASNMAEQSRAELAKIKDEKQDLAKKCESYQKELELLKHQADELRAKADRADSGGKAAVQAHQEQSIKELREQNHRLSEELQFKKDELQAMVVSSAKGDGSSAHSASEDGQRSTDAELEAKQALQKELEEVNGALQEMLVRNMALQEKLSTHQAKLDALEKQEREIKLLLSKHSDNVWSPSDSGASTVVILSNLLADIEVGSSATGNDVNRSSNKHALKPKDINRMQSRPGVNQGSTGGQKTEGKHWSGQGGEAQEALVVSEVPMQENVEDLARAGAGKTKGQRGGLFRMLSGTSAKANKSLDNMKADMKNAQQRLRGNEDDVQALKNEISHA